MTHCNLDFETPPHHQIPTGCDHKLFPPGIGHSPDKMLQARIFSYADAHRYRLGVNHDLIPVNKPRCPVMNYHRDGFMRVDENSGARVNYEPNSFSGPVQRAAFDEPPLRITGEATRYNHRDSNDDYTQAGNLYISINEPGTT